MTLQRLRKLRAMSLHEIATRGSYAAFTAVERILHRRGDLAKPGRLRHALAPSLAGRQDWMAALARRDSRATFFAGCDPETPAVFERRFRDEQLEVRRIAAEVAAGTIEFFGERFSFPSGIDWHADPVTRAGWPRLYHRDVPIHGGNRGYGDVKYVWELNRHQFLVDLARSVVLDPAAAPAHMRSLQELVDDWLTSVPYGTGAAWACALEPAFRAWSWMWAYHMVRSQRSLDEAFHARWLTGFYDHGRFLHRHLETYASPYNHLIGEASALFALGLLFPEFKEARAWAARGRSVLEAALPEQFHADGGTVEQSTFYHHATLGFYLLSAVLGRRNGAELSRAVWDAIERGIEYSLAIVQPDGRVPRIGGADDGKPIRLEHLPFYDFRPYQAIGAVIFDRPDFRFAAGRFWEDAFWILGTEGMEAFDRLQAAKPPTAHALPASGYYIARSDWTEGADYLLFDCGPQAGGLRRDDVPSAAHGHADCLSVVATLAGREVLVDPGFFCYNGPPEWEVHFRRTRAHNTIVLDGRDQATHISKMAWCRTYEPRVEGWSADGAVSWVRGSHDGYARQEHPVRHRRLAWLRPGGYIVLFDELIGEGEHTFESTFQFAPGTLVLNGDGTSVTFEERFELTWAGSAPVEPGIVMGGDDPDGGWIAPSLGIRKPAPKLTLRGRMTDRFSMLMILSDGTRRDSGRRLRIENGPGEVFRTDIQGGEWRDQLIASMSEGGRIPGVETDAPVVVVTSRDGRVESVHQAGGTRVELAGAPRIG